MEYASEVEHGPELSSEKGEEDGAIYSPGPFHPCLKTPLAFLAFHAPKLNILGPAKNPQSWSQVLALGCCLGECQELRGNRGSTGSVSYNGPYHVTRLACPESLHPYVVLIFLWLQLTQGLIGSGVVLINK